VKKELEYFEKKVMAGYTESLVMTVTSFFAKLFARV
jgi:hypothetical protein